MANYRRGDSTLLREMNLSLVLRHLHQNGPLSRAQLANRTRLNKSTISSLVEELLNRELIREHGINISGSGRPSTLLNLNPHAGSIIGVEIGVGFLIILLTSFTGEVIWRQYEELGSSTEQDSVLARAFELVEEASAIARNRGDRLLGVGLTLPGLVDVERGVLVFSPNLQWRDVPLRSMFAQRTGLPVFVDNDANAAALGEHLFGVARQQQHFIFIIAGVGVGGGLFLNGEVYRGANGLAGEIGHTSIFIDQNRPCRCGNRGCWENSANLSSLIERVRARLDVGRRSLITGILQTQNTPLNLSVILQAAEAGDEQAQDALRETGSAIGLGVANLIDIFNPEMVVIGGAMSVAAQFLLPAIQKVVEERALEAMRKQVRVLFSPFGPYASVMGAVAMVKQDILSNPLSACALLSATGKKGGDVEPELINDVLDDASVAV